MKLATLVLMNMVLFIGSCGDDSPGGSKKSKIDEKIVELCSSEFSSEVLDAETKCVDANAYDLDMIMTCLEGMTSCDGLELVYCIAEAETCNPENCETAVLSCPESEYYHAHPRDPDGGDTYVISEAFGECSHSRLSSGAGTVGTEVRTCVDGECVASTIIVETICTE